MTFNYLGFFMRGLSRVTIFGEITAMEISESSSGGKFNVVVNVLENYSIQTPTGIMDRKEFHRVVIYGGAAKLASKFLKVGCVFFTESGMLRTTENKSGRFSRIITYDIEILDQYKTKKETTSRAKDSISNIKQKLNAKNND